MVAGVRESVEMNSIEAANGRKERGALGWVGPLLVLALPTTAAFTLSLGVSALFAASGDTDAAGSTIAWANVWVLGIYVPVMFAVVWLVRREGLGVLDLVGLERTRARRDLLQGLGMTVVFWISLGVSSFVAGVVVFGVFGTPLAGGEAEFAYPNSPVFYVASLALLPLAAGIVEEVSYRGYALPRLAALCGKVPAVFVVAFFFGLQHVGIAFAADWRFALMRGVSLFLVGIILGAIYLRQKRLAPLIIGHVMVNVIGLGLPAVLL